MKDKHSVEIVTSDFIYNRKENVPPITTYFGMKITTLHECGYKKNVCLCRFASHDELAKPFVIDRKNFLFANTPKGATGSAVMFSLIQTALENGLNPYNYLTWLLRKAKNADLTDTGTAQSLLPWNAVTECQTK